MRNVFRKAVIPVLAVTLFCTTVSASEIDDLRQKKSAAQSEVNTLQSELTTVIANLSQLENDLIAKGQEIAEAQAELDEAEALEETQRSAMSLRIKYMYETGNPSFFTTVAASEDVADVINKAEYADEISSYDRQKIEEYIALENQIQELKTNLETERTEMEALQAEYQVQQENLNSMIAVKQQEVNNFDAQLQQAIAEEEARRRAAAEEAARQAARQAAQQRVTVTGGASSVSEAAQQAAQADSEARASEQTAEAAAADDGGGEEIEEYLTDAYQEAYEQAYEEEYEEAEQEVQTASSYGQASPVVYDSAKANAIISAAYSQIGVPYVWGGTSPGVGLDCSGLTQYCYRCAGISIPRTSGEQLAGGTIVSDPQPGDICWTPGHVAIYIGNGQMIEAQQTGVPVKVSSVRVTYYVRY